VLKLHPIWQIDIYDGVGHWDYDFTLLTYNLKVGWTSIRSGICIVNCYLMNYEVMLGNLGDKLLIQDELIRSQHVDGELQNLPLSDLVFLLGRIPGSQLSDIDLMLEEYHIVLPIL